MLAHYSVFSQVPCTIFVRQRSEQKTNAFLREKFHQIGVQFAVQNQTYFYHVIVWHNVKAIN